MNATVARSLAPVLFGIVSLGTVACAANPTESSKDPAAEAATNLSGSVGLPGAAVPPDAPSIPLGATELQAAAATTELVTDSGQIFDVLSYSFGIEAGRGDTVGIARDYVANEPARFERLRIEVRPKATAPSLLVNAGSGSSVGKLLLRQRTSDATKPKMIDLAIFEQTFVRAMRTTFESGTVDTYELDFGRVSLVDGNLTVSYDLVSEQASCSVSPCPCGEPTSARLGPYAQAAVGLPVPKHAIRIDAATVSVAQESLPPTAGAAVSVAKLEDLSVEGPRERSGVCAFYLAAQPHEVPVLQIDSITTVDLASARPLVDQSWTACRASVQKVHFTGTNTQSSEHLSFSANALLRTAGTTTSGWSFQTNAPITSCQ
jgi:hypothetical protein